MSYRPPLTNPIVLSSGAISIASGSVTIQLTLEDKSSSFDENYDIDVIDLGAIEVDYNYVEDVGDIDDFKVNVPSFSLKIRDYLAGNLSSLYGYVYGDPEASFIAMVKELDAIDLIICSIDFNGSKSFYYSTREQVEFSYKDRSVKISFQHPLRYGVASSVAGKSFDLSGKEVDLYRDQDVGADPTTKTAYFVRDVIDEFLDTISSAATLVNRSELYESNYSNPPTSGGSAYLLGDLPAYDIEELTPYLKRVALSECAIIGTILGYTYFVPRYSKNTLDRSNVTADDLESIDLDHSFRSVRTYNFNYDIADRNGYTTDVEENNVTINNFGLYDVNVSYGFIGTTPAIYDSAYDNGLSVIPVYLSGDITDKDGNSQSYYNVAQPVGFSSEILPSWREVFRIPQSVSDDAGFSISGKILGVEKLKPYGYIHFPNSSGIHPLVDGRDFRPSYLKYDLIEDIIEFEAYEF